MKESSKSRGIRYIQNEGSVLGLEERIEKQGGTASNRPCLFENRQGLFFTKKEQLLKGSQKKADFLCKRK